jgi:trehalose/maltose hydrolase-like predicted phosphorylase
MRLSKGGLNDKQEGPTMHRALEPNSDPTWMVCQQELDLPRERDIESRLAIGNGFLGVRGAPDMGRAASWLSVPRSLAMVSWPRSYVAGLFDTPDLDPPVPVLMAVPNWLRIRLRFNDVALRDLHATRSLDLRRGVLFSQWQGTASHPGLQLQKLRIASMADRAIALQLLRFTGLKDGVAVALEAWFDTTNVGLDAIDTTNDLGRWRCDQSRTNLAMAAEALLSLDDVPLVPTERGPLRWSWNWTARRGQIVCFERRVAVARGDDTVAERAGAALKRAQVGWRKVLAAHVAAWAERWRCSDISVVGDDEAQKALRFAVHHLNAAANPDDPTVSIGARGLTGDGYHGHVFWDTEIYMLPFYILTWPEAARTLLQYRHHTLDGARRKAAAAGWRGAMYAWESAGTGDEVTPDHIIASNGQVMRVLCGTQEQHITADVAYAVWSYWQATADSAFLRDAGAEIILETARFWASRAAREADGRCHIRGVIGPDEFYESIDDNAFTNMMAQWNLGCGGSVAALLQSQWPEDWARLAARLHLDEVEIANWQQIGDALVTGYDPQTGLFEQFAGYYGQAKRNIKQADVVALLALLPEQISRADIERNFHFYEPRCVHESSLSRPMHGLVAARLGEVALALEAFRASAAIDLDGLPGSSAAGLHMAALGGLWQVTILGFAGVSWRSGQLHLDPHLPPGWTSLSFTVQWQGREVLIKIDTISSGVTIALLSGSSLPIFIQGVEHHVVPDQTMSVGLAS